MNGVRDYYILERCTQVIARHADFPEKASVVQEWAADIENRFTLGELDTAQKERLLMILKPEVTRPAFLSQTA